MVRWILTAMIQTMMLGLGLAVVIVGAAEAEERRIHLAAPAGLVETGFLRHLLPRFSLKNGVPVTVVPPDAEAEVGLSVETTPDARAVFTGGGITYHLAIAPSAKDNPFVGRLATWLRSDPGMAAIESFSGSPAFAVAKVQAVEAVAEILPGNIGRGKSLSLSHCGRCHVIGAENRLNGIGNTPSFAVMRTLPDWEFRFASYYALNPHPAFTRIDGVSDPYSDGRTPTIAPVVLTLEDLEDILAFAASIAPANLGAPMKHQ